MCRRSCSSNWKAFAMDSDSLKTITRSSRKMVYRPRWDTKTTLELFNVHAMPVISHILRLILLPLWPCFCFYFYFLASSSGCAHYEERHRPYYTNRLSKAPPGRVFVIISVVAAACRTTTVHIKSHYLNWISLTIFHQLTPFRGRRVVICF